jgi:hypothetical protein
VLVVTHAPEALQLCDFSPEHCIEPGTHEPEQTPAPVQTYGHELVVVHVPDALQV